MISDPWTTRLSDYLDGELSEAERRALERHLGACPACTATVARLLQVVERARALPDRPPGADLWSGVAARIAEPPSSAERRAVRGRRWAFSLPQLAAAALAVAFTSGGGAIKRGIAKINVGTAIRQPYEVASKESVAAGQQAVYDATVRVLTEELELAGSAPRINPLD